MKNTAKVFLILSTVWGVISTLSGIITLVDGEYVIGAISLVSGLLAAVISIIANRRLARAMTKRELRGIGIVTLLFANVVGGILLLTMSDYELGGYTQGIPYYVQTPNGQQPYGQQPYGQQPPYGQSYQNTTYRDPNMPPYGGAYGAPFAAPTQNTDEATDNGDSDTPPTDPFETV